MKIEKMKDRTNKQKNAQNISKHKKDRPVFFKNVVCMHHVIES